jgi:predicted ArsR family transcriptional regulator
MDVQDIQGEARALGDPTRFSLFRYIVDSDQPVGVAELTAYVQLNHNAIRQHLAVLRDAQLVVEEIEVRETPGRPRLLYRLHPEAAGKWETPSPYTWLARRLSDAVKYKRSPRQVGAEDGLRRGLENSSAGDSVDAMEQQLVQRGFRPTRSERGRKVDFVLGRCPFAEVAADNPDTVCQLHLGLAEGLAQGLGGLTVERLTAKDAHRAGCRLVVKRDSVPA